MDDQPAQPIPVPDAAPVPATAPAEETWLLHYNGTEPLTKGAYTWQPDQVIPVPESVARTLFGSDNLRVVTDLEMFNALKARPNG